MATCQIGNKVLIINIKRAPNRACIKDT